MSGKNFICFVIGLIMLYALGQVVYDKITGNDRESVQRREQESSEQAEREAVERAEFEKEDARRSFALKESPVLWKTIEDLKTNIIEQNGKLARLEKTFKDLGMDKDADADYIAIVGERDEMVKKLLLVEDELDQAYLASVKYEVTRGKAQKSEFERKAEVDGISEASQSRRKYEDLRREK